jgi:hypothetical protein
VSKSLKQESGSITIEAKEQLKMTPKETKFHDERSYLPMSENIYATIPVNQGDKTGKTDAPPRFIGHVYNPEETAGPQLLVASSGNVMTADTWNKCSLIALISVNTVLSIICITLNFVMINFRLKARSTRCLAHFLYLQNGVADVFVGLGVLLQSPIMYLLISWDKEIHDMTISAYMSYFVTGVAVKMSVFLNCVLGVVRCIQIVKPYYQINKRALTVSTVLYMLAWMSIVGLDLVQYTLKKGTKNQVLMVKSLVMKGLPGFGVFLTMPKGDPTQSLLAYHLGKLVQFILPTAIPTLLCSVLMIFHLCNMPKKMKGTNVPKKGDGVSKASLTIFMLTSVYVLTSAVSIITWLIVDGQAGNLVSQTTKKREGVSWSVLTVIYFALSTCALLCSTLTPLILLFRGTGVAFSSVRQLLSSTRSTIINWFKPSQIIVSDVVSPQPAIVDRQRKF